MSNPFLFSILVFFLVLVVCFIGFYLYNRFQKVKEQSQRIKQVVNFSGPTGITSPQNKAQDAKVTINESKDNKDPKDNTGLRRDSRISNIPLLNEILSKFFSESLSGLKILLEQTGLKIKVGEYLLFIFCLAVIGWLVVELTLKVPFVGSLIAIIPFFGLNVLKQKRLDAFVTQLPQALDMLSGDIRAGLDVQQGLRHVAEEFSPPLGEEFAKVNAEMGLGLSIADALNNLVKRMNTMDVQILCTGIIINRELGGNLGELLGSVCETIKERFRLKGMVKSLTAENSASAYLLMGLPIGLFFLLNGMAPETYKSFMQDPVGRGAIYGCIGSMTIGFIIIKKITKLEV